MFKHTAQHRLLRHRTLAWVIQGQALIGRLGDTSAGFQRAGGDTIVHQFHNNLMSAGGQSFRYCTGFTQLIVDA